MSKKRPNTLFTMSTTLLIIAGVAGICLSTVYSLTKEPILEVVRKKTENAILEVVPQFDSRETKQVISYDNGDSLTLHYVFNQGELVGVAVESYTNAGFSGLIRVMVGFAPDLSITGTKVLEHKETPGLGTKMEDDDFKIQFIGKQPESFNLGIRNKDIGGEVDGITAATISARAFCDAVDRAYKTVNKHIDTTQN